MRRLSFEGPERTSLSLPLFLSSSALPYVRITTCPISEAACPCMWLVLFFIYFLCFLASPLGWIVSTAEDRNWILPAPEPATGTHRDAVQSPLSMRTYLG